MELDQEACYRAVKGRDRRFDGMFYTAVRTTGIYCRPSCPAITPRRRNVSFYRTAAGAQVPATGPVAGACPMRRRAHPSGTSRPTSPSRAMRLVSDGVVERDGVEGLASALGYSTRQLNRVVTQEYGAGPLALARSRRAQTARVLIETTDLSFADIAFAAGFASVRQFNDTVREVYAASPTKLREGSATRRVRGRSANRAGTIRTRIAVREPFAADDLHFFLAMHVVRGIEAAGLGGTSVAPAPARPRGRPPRAGRQTHWAGPVHVHADRCARSGSGARAHSTPPRCRLRPGRRGRGVVRGQRVRRVVSWTARAARARPPRRRRARRPDGARATGQPRVCTHGRGQAGRGARRAACPRRRSPGDPPVPDRRDDRVHRPRHAADAALAWTRADRTGRGPGHRRGPARPQHRPRRDPGCSAGAAGDWTLDCGLRDDAGARRPRRVPPRPMSGCAMPRPSWTSRTCTDAARPGGHGVPTR